jgi:DNA-binding GntR family transcriptional regulator
MNLVEKDIAGKFNSSRVPIREALRILDGEGLISYKRYSGYKVKTINLEELIEIGTIQKLLERELLQRAIPRYTEMTYFTIRGLLRQLKKKKEFEEQYMLLIKISETLMEPANWNYSLDILRKIMHRNIILCRTLSVKYFTGTVPAAGHDAFFEKFMGFCKEKEMGKAIELWCNCNDHIQMAVPLLLQEQDRLTA